MDVLLKIKDPKLSLGQSDGLRALLDLATRKHYPKEAAATEIWGDWDDSVQMNLVFIGNLMRGIERLYKHVSVNRDKEAALMCLEVKIDRLLLQQKEAISLGTIGFMYLNDLKPAITAHLYDPVFDSVRKEIDASAPFLEQTKEAMAKEPISKPDADWCLRSIEMGEYEALRMSQPSK
jgi:hypothetical protein